MRIQLMPLCLLLALLPGLASAKEQCPRMFPMMISLLCASDGVITKTFTTIFEMEAANCHNRNDNKPEFHKLYDGKCK